MKKFIATFFSTWEKRKKKKNFLTFEISLNINEFLMTDVMFSGVRHEMFDLTVKTASLVDCNYNGGKMGVIIVK